MKRFAYIVLAIAAMVAFSCEEEHEIRLDDQDQKLLLQCFPGMSDTTWLYLCAATPVTQKDSIAPDISDAVVRFMVNGKEQVLRRDSDDTGRYYYTGAFSAGDKITVDAEAKGLDPVSASTVMPAPVGVVDLNLSKLDAGEFDRYLHLDIGLPGSSEDDYYGVAVMVHSVQKYKVCQSDYIYDDDGNIIDIKYNYGNYICDSSDHYSPVYVYKVIDNGLGLEVSDELIDFDMYYDLVQSYRIEAGIDRLFLLNPGMIGGKKRFDCFIDYFPDNENASYFEDGSLKNYSSYHSEYKLVLYKISPEVYRFAKARYDISENMLGAYGLAPASFTYTNVRGGFGVLGALSFSDTGWFKVD